MTQDDVTNSDIRSALAEAARVADLRDEAASVPGGAPRARTRWLPVATVALVLVVSWDVYVLTRPPETLPRAELEADLRIIVAAVVEEVDDFRATQGRLPRADEMADVLLDEGMSYTVEGERYVLVAEDGASRLRYDGSEPLDAWVEGVGPRVSGAGGPP
jgi:hypothetical protein